MDLGLDESEAVDEEPETDSVGAATPSPPEPGPTTPDTSTTLEGEAASTELPAEEPATSTATPTAAAVPTSTAIPTRTPTPTQTPIPELGFSSIRVVGNPPSQVQILFSLRDQGGHSVVLPAELLQAGTRIYELGPGTEGWEEIDYVETSFFVHSAENFELEVVFVLDFTKSMALAALPDGRSGIEVMLEAFETALTGLPGAHRAGVVEFHDRNVEPGVLSQLTTDRDFILDSVAAFASSSFEPGSSRVWDSIQTAAGLFTDQGDNPNVVRALVFLSDGRDTSSVSAREDAGAIAAQQAIQLYAVGVGEVYE